MRLMQLVIAVTLLAVFSPIITKPSFAEMATPSVTPESSRSSYVLFYPIVAGTTANESSYIFKLIRDRLSELFTFGDEKKSELSLRIATKRILEVEKLLKNKPGFPIEQTLSKFNTKLAAAYDYAMKSLASDSFPDLVDQINQQTEKYQIILNQMLDIVPNDQKSLIEDSIKRTREIQERVKQELEIE